MRLSVDDTFRKYGDRIFSAAFSVCQNKADADDVVQETLIRYYSLGKDFENEPHLKAWLMRVAINRAKRYHIFFLAKKQGCVGGLHRRTGIRRAGGQLIV